MFSAIGSPRAYLAGTQSSLCQPDKCCYSTHLGWDGVGCHFSATEAEKWFVSTFKYRQFSAYTPTLFTWETTCCIETDIHTIGCPYCSSSDCDLKIENCFQLCAESHLLSKDKLTWITYLSTSWLTISDFICVFFTLVCSGIRPGPVLMDIFWSSQAALQGFTAVSMCPIIKIMQSSF